MKNLWQKILSIFWEPSNQKELKEELLKRGLSSYLTTTTSMQSADIGVHLFQLCDHTCGGGRGRGATMPDLL